MNAPKMPDPQEWATKYLEETSCGADDTDLPKLTDAFQRFAEAYASRTADLKLKLAEAHIAAQLWRERAERVERQLAIIMETLNRQGSVTHGPITEYSQIPFAIRDLQECYADAARARNGLYTKIEDHAHSLERQLAEALLAGEQRAEQAPSVEARYWARETLEAVRRVLGPAGLSRVPTE